MKYHIIPVTTFNQNCYIIYCKYTKEAVIVDPGGNSDRIKYKISSLNGINIKSIWLTHGHIDHVGSAKELSVFYNVPIMGPHVKEENLLLNLPKQCKMFNYRYIKPFRPNKWLSNKDILNFGKLFFVVLHCPGHSPGHVIFWNKKEKIVLTGDTLLKNSIGRTDLPYSNFKDIISSIKNVILKLGDNITILPGHGQISNLKYEKDNNPFL